MIPGRFSKQPYEEFFWGADFSDVLDTDNESILLASSSIAAVDSTGETDDTVYYLATLMIVSLTILAVRVKAGTAALSSYKLTYKITTSSGNKYEKDVFMSVLDV